MGNRQIRSSQLVAPFGPGSIYTDRKGIPLVVAGLDQWYLRIDGSNGSLIDNEFDVFEPRISAQIGIDFFRKPPDFRQRLRLQEGAKQPNNVALEVPAYRFPSWYRNTKSGALRKFNPDAQIISAEKGEKWDPVRFISVCKNGHISEFPWKEWVGCTCNDETGLVLLDSGGSELTSVRVKCNLCPEGSKGRRGRSLAKTTKIPSTDHLDSNGKPECSEFEINGIACPGTKPWLGMGDRGCRCDAPRVAALINQLNLYFGKIFSAIALPMATDSSLDELCTKIKSVPRIVGQKMIWSGGDKDMVRDSLCARFAKEGCDVSPEAMLRALEIVFDGKSENLVVNSRQPEEPESSELAFRRAEFDIIRSDSVDSPELVVRTSRVPEGIAHLVSKVNLIERLRETRVFCGFDRLKQSNDPLAGMPHRAVNQLFYKVPEEKGQWWLPATVVFGEGLYIELSNDAILAWQKRNADWLQGRFDDGFVARLSAIKQAHPPLAAASRNWASRLILVHTLSHIILNQLVFECGYSTASLRERIFVSSDRHAPMSGILIYTAAGDSEGTLGGLVRLGRPEFLGAVIERALKKAYWCSADPVCSENLGGQGSRMVNMAACHSCSLMPETSCECFNQGLDRATVVGTPRNRHVGFAASLLTS